MHTLNIESRFKSVIELKNRKVKLEALISVEPDEEQKSKYQHLKSELDRAIQFSESQLEILKQENETKM
jgi:hypothetical protein